MKAAITAATLVLAGCGGGGGGDSTSISVSPTSLSFTYEEGAAPVTHKTVHVTFRGDGVVVGFPPEATDFEWVHVAELGHDGNSASFDVWPDASLGPGTHETTLRFVTGRVSNQGDVSGIKYKDVQLSLTVTTNDLSISGSPAMLSFETFADGPVPAAQPVEISYNGDTAYVESAPDWLIVEATGSTSPITFQVRPATTSGAGTRVGHVIIATSRVDNTIIRRHGVEVTYLTRDPTAIAGTLQASQFIFGSSVAAAGGAVDVTSTQTWAAASSAPWLTVNGDAHTGNAQLPVQIDVSGLAIGTYSADITVTNVADPAEVATWTATVQVAAPTLTTSANSLLIGGSNGFDPNGATFGFSINTGYNPWPWTLTLDGGSWLSSTSTSGTAFDQVVTLNADRDAVAGGTYTGSAQLSVDVNGYVLTKTVPITFNKEAERLYVMSEGVALTQLPSRQVLSRTIGVVSTFGYTDRPWQASSDQSWLSVTPSGVTGDSLTLTADPTGLAAGQHFATVTVTSDHVKIENEQSVRVGLYVAAADPPADLLTTTEVVLHTASSPVEPLVYANGDTNLITAYNVYTGAIVRSFPAGTDAPSHMVFSGDGRTLFVLDSPAETVRVLDAATGELVRTYPYDIYDYYKGREGLAYGRPGALPALYISGGPIIDLSTQTVLDTWWAWYDMGPVTITQDSLTAYVHGFISSSNPVSRYALRRTALNGGGLSSTQTSAPTEFAGSDIAVSPQGDRVYITGRATQSGGKVSVRDPVTLAEVAALPGNAPFGANSLDTAWNGMLLAGAQDYYGNFGDPTRGDGHDIHVYAPDGTLLDSMRCTGTNDSWFVSGTANFSSDALRFTCASDRTYGSSHLQFHDAPAY